MGPARLRRPPAPATCGFNAALPWSSSMPALPPPIELAGMACAGCLSFEMSTGTYILLTNGGAPARAVRAAQTTWRATATHNTLALNEQSSSRLLRDARLEGQIGAAPIRHPDRVSCDVREINGAIALEASHNGYLSRFGLVHRRTLTLDASGERLEGIDVLTAAKGVLRFSRHSLRRAFSPASGLGGAPVADGRDGGAVFARRTLAVRSHRGGTVD